MDTSSTASVTIQHLGRAVTEAVNDTLKEDSLDDVVTVPPQIEENDENANFDPRIFWSVNGFILVLFISVICYCCYGDLSWLTNMHERRRETDAEYQARVRQREERRKKAKIMSPEKRRRLLLASFRRHQVSMTVEEKDIVNMEDPSEFTKPDIEQQQDQDHEQGEDDSMMGASMTSLNHAGQLRLPTQALVPNCCAICLGDYDVGDQVVWSSNQECPHAFHQECIIDWLIKMQPATPCPCCRQEFTDWQEIAKARKIKWTADNALDIGRISF